MPPQLFNTSFLLFYHSLTHSAMILALHTFPFLFGLFSQTVTPPSFSRLCHCDKIRSFQSWGRIEHSKPLHLGGNFEAPCPPWSICHHAECQEVSLGLTTSHCSAWHSEREKERKAEGGGEREEQRENEPDKGPETDPSHSAEPREYAAGLSAPLISQRQPPWQCDTDYWKPWFRLFLWLRVAAKAAYMCSRAHTHTHPHPHPHPHTHTPTHTHYYSPLFPAQNAWTAFNFI